MHRCVRFCLLAGMLLGLPRVAHALSGVLTCGPSSTFWVVSDGDTSSGAYSGSCSGVVPGTGGTVVDAGFVVYGDAFDLGYHLFVDGTSFGAPGSIVGCTYSAGPATLSGLNVSMQYFASSTDAILRVRHVFSNPTGSPISVIVDMPVNFGSDGNTIIRGTSSGDTTFTAADRWLVTSDTGPGDPVNTTVLFGPGSPAETPTSVTSAVFDCAATNGAGASYALTIPANSTRSLMYFAALGDHQATNTVAGATGAAARFNSNASLGGDLLAGLTASELAQTLNWDFQQTDTDGDGVGDASDNCPEISNPDQADGDGDGFGDACDNCPQDASSDQTDTDGDGIGDPCDPCDDRFDADGDGDADNCDNCPAVANPDQANNDGDSFGDACDNCPNDTNQDQADGDADGVGDVCDNCPNVPNADQADLDGDGIGNVCDDNFFSTAANQFAGLIYLRHQNVYKVPIGSSQSSQISQFGPGFLPSSPNVGLDALDVQGNGDIEFSTSANGFVNHTAGSIYVRQQNVYELDIVTGVITEIVNWASLGINLQDLDALDRLDANRYAISTSTNQTVSHAGGSIYLRQENVYVVNVATRTIQAAPLLNGAAIGLTSLGLDAVDVFPDGRIGFSTGSNGFVTTPSGPFYVRQENAYVRSANGSVVQALNGGGLQLQSLDALTLGAGME